MDCRSGLSETCQDVSIYAGSYYLNEGSLREEWGHAGIAGTGLSSHGLMVAEMDGDIDFGCRKSRNDADVRSGCNRRDTTPITNRRCELGFDTQVVFLFDLIGIG